MNDKFSLEHSRQSLLSLLVTLAGLVCIFCTAGLAENFSVPLTRTNGWQFFTYRKIVPNVFRPTPSGLEICVTNSAAPAIFPLTNALGVLELRVTGKISGTLRVSAEKQGSKGFDDYTLRVGLVEAGTRTLSRREQLMAADWVKKLFALAPRGTGISRIHFFNLGTSPAQIGETRAHPMSDLLQETIVAVPDANGDFSFTRPFPHPIRTLAIWIACDGDDSKSSFTVNLTGLELVTEGK